MTGKWWWDQRSQKLRVTETVVAERETTEEIVLIEVLPVVVGVISGICIELIEVCKKWGWD